MSKRKRKRRLRPRTIWWLVLGYFVLGAVVAALFLQQMTAGAPRVGAGEPSINNAWGLFPLVVMLWPIFLVVYVVRALF
ncbi:MAG: hypothetical protein R3C71_06610 [Candidatus Krumholzibacteriia bacterium]